MKIVLNDVNDVEDFLRMLSPAYFRLIQKASAGMDVLADNMTGPTTVDEYRRAESEAERYISSGQFDAELAHAGIACEPDGLPTDIAPPERDKPSEAEVEANIAVHSRDSDGVQHDTDWHSDPPKINADGRWRARRKRDEDAYKAWLLEQAVEVAESAVAADAEPVATETHALPQDEDSRDAGADYAGEGGKPHPGFGHTEPGDSYEPETAGDPAPTVDLAALVEASQEAALDASDSHMDLIKACQAFISDHGHPAYNALKAAVAPLEGAENGKAVPQFTPAERRLMRACIDKYPLN